MTAERANQDQERLPACGAPRRGEWFYVAHLPGAVTKAGVDAILQAGVSFFGADPQSPWQTLVDLTYNQGWEEAYEAYVEAHHPAWAASRWPKPHTRAKEDKRRYNAVQLGFLRLPREWVLAAGPQLPKTRNPIDKDGVYVLHFLSANQIDSLAQRGLTPWEVVASVDLHPSMAHFLSAAAVEEP